MGVWVWCTNCAKRKELIDLPISCKSVILYCCALSFWISQLYYSPSEMNRSHFCNNDPNLTRSNWLVQEKPGGGIQALPNVKHLNSVILLNVGQLPTLSTLPLSQKVFYRVLCYGVKLHHFI